LLHPFGSGMCVIVPMFRSNFNKPDVEFENLFLFIMFNKKNTSSEFSN